MYTPLTQLTSPARSFYYLGIIIHKSVFLFYGMLSCFYSAATETKKPLCFEQKSHRKEKNITINLIN